MKQAVEQQDGASEPVEGETRWAVEQDDGGYTLVELGHPLHPDGSARRTYGVHDGRFVRYPAVYDSVPAAAVAALLRRAGAL
jgi:hypothetical protein